jgi:hypothetical protein
MFAITIFPFSKIEQLRETTFSFKLTKTRTCTWIVKPKSIIACIKNESATITLVCHFPGLRLGEPFAQVRRSPLQ